MYSTARDVIHDTHATSVDGEISGDGGNYIHLRTSEWDALHSAFAQLGTALHQREIGVHFHGREYTVLPAQSRISVQSGGGLRAELALVRAGDPPTAWILLTYSLYVHARGGRVCSFVGNPTTLVAGSNIRPIRVDGVGQMGELLTFFRIGFDFVCALFPRFAWSSETAASIAAGRIAVSNTQWALYLPTSDRDRDMALLCGLYAARLNHATTSRSLAEHLGFECTGVLKAPSGALSGLFLTRRWGRNHVLSVNFYDKRQSVANKHQGAGLDTADAALLAATIRLDVTAHTAWLEGMIRAAQAHIAVLEGAKPHLRAALAGFCEATTPTAARVCRAMNLLSYTVVAGALVHRGFTPWLIERVLRDELRLVSLLGCTLDVLDVDHADPTCAAALRAWRAAPDAADPLDAIARACSCTARHARRVRDRLLADCAVDVAIPYGYWLDYLTASLTYGTPDAERETVVRAVFGRGDAAARVAVLDAANARRSAALERGRAALLHSLGVVARAVEATPLVALLGDGGFWTDARVDWARIRDDARVIA